MIAKRMRTWLGLLLALLAGAASGEGLRTADPLEAFVRGEYPLGDDYFIHGNADTFLLRCVLTLQRNGVDGLALSEVSIWGNQTGPWEIFRKEPEGGYRYLETRHLADLACLESCRSQEYLTSGQCRWKPGWPEP